MRGAVTRRALLMAGMGFAAAGCNVRVGAQSPKVGAVTCSRQPIVQITVPVDTEQEAHDFAAADPLVAPVSWRQKPYPNTPWFIGPALAFLPPNGYTPLDPAMRRLNFDSNILLPGTAEAFQDGGQAWALPGYVQPLAVAYQPAAFTTAGVPLPTPDWTIDDFERACAALARAIRTGRLKGISTVLPAMAPAPGQKFTSLQPNFENIGSSGVWGGFIYGYGGTSVTAGRYDLTNPGALVGVQKLVDLVRLYGADQVLPPPGAAMGFTYYPPDQSLPTIWRFARVPRLPVRPVVPATLTGWMLGRNSAAQMAEATDADTEAVIQFCLWSYRRQSQGPASTHQPPVLVDTAVQSAYWQADARAKVGADAVGDPGHYLYTHQGWPLMTSTGNVGVSTALVSAVHGQGDLRTLLSNVEQVWNAAAAAYAADKANRAKAEQQKASVAATFGPDQTAPSPDRVSEVCAAVN